MSDNLHNTLRCPLDGYSRPFRRSEYPHILRLRPSHWSVGPAKVGGVECRRAVLVRRAHANMPILKPETPLFARNPKPARWFFFLVLMVVVMMMI